MDVRDVLKDLGLDEKERDIYLYLLQHGQASQQHISDSTGIRRQTVYDRLNKMEQDGHVAYARRGKRKVYHARSPNHLLQQLRDKQDRLQEVMPELERMEDEEPIDIHSEAVRGLDGVKALVNKTLDASGETLWIDNMEKAEDIFEEYYFLNIAERRAANDIPLKMLIEPTDETRWDTDASIQRETRRSELVDDLGASFAMFDDHVIIYSFDQGQLFGVHIRNQSIEDAMERVFFKLWDDAG